MTLPPRDEMLLRMLAHQAVAAEYERLLKDGVANVFEKDKAADTSRFQGIGLVSAVIAADTTTIVDQDVFLDWLERNHPTEVTTEVVTVRRARNPAWVKALLGQLQPVDPSQPAGETSPVMDVEGTQIPGLRWRRGGTFKHASIRPDAGLVRRLTAAAQVFAATGRPMPELGLTPPPPPLELEGSADNA
jgi:hypothetical protein